MSGGRRNSLKPAEEVITFNDGQEEVETHWRSKWRIVDIIMTVLMAMLYAFIVYRHRKDALGSLQWIFSVMLLFLLYPIVSYCLVFLISVIVYACLSVSNRPAAAHKLIYFYSWLKHIIEGAILMFSCLEALRGLIGNKYDNFVYLQVFFALVLFIVMFKVIRMIWVFFRSGRSEASIQTVMLGGGLFRISPENSTKKTTEVVEMMEKMGEGKMVGEDERVTVEGLDIN